MQEVINIIENTKDLLQQKKPEGFEDMIDELTRASALVTEVGVKRDGETQKLRDEIQNLKAGVTDDESKKMLDWINGQLPHAGSCNNLGEAIGFLVAESQRLTGLANDALEEGRKAIERKKKLEDVLREVNALIEKGPAHEELTNAQIKIEEALRPPVEAPPAPPVEAGAALASEAKGQESDAGSGSDN